MRTVPVDEDVVDEDDDDVAESDCIDDAAEDEDDDDEHEDVTDAGFLFDGCADDDDKTLTLS